MAKTGDITLNAIKQRYAELADDIRETPTLDVAFPILQDHAGLNELTLKLECLQHTGTFKARGALSNARAIPADRHRFGVTAASAGNHAIAAAWAARAAGMSAKVVMQDTANPFRIACAKGQGAEVVLKAPGAATFAEAERLAKEDGMTFIHPFDGENTVLGTAGVGLELMTQVPDLDAVIVSIGGGGLISGIAAAVKQIKPGCQVFGVEPEGAAGMSKSLAAGEPLSLDRVETIADSLGAPMALPLGHALCAAYVDEVVTVSDDAICAGMVLFQEHAKLAVEPAAGAVLAALLGTLGSKLTGKRVGVVVCGANIDSTTYAQQLVRGAAYLETPALSS